MCKVPDCEGVAEEPPDNLKFLGVPLCFEHHRRLLIAWGVALSVHDDPSFAEMVVLREAQGLMHGRPFDPLYLVEDP